MEELFLFINIVKEKIDEIVISMFLRVRMQYAPTITFTFNPRFKSWVAKLEK